MREVKKSNVLMRKTKVLGKKTTISNRLSILERGKRTLVKIKLHTGRFHQIRAQFASRRMPIVGDGKYGSRDNLSVFPALMSFKLSIKMKSEKATVKALPDTDSYPWSLFGDEDKYKELVEND